MGVTAFIPAKMTSQRLPAKNMRQLGGQPLLYYSIKAAQLTPGISRVIVSSEDDAVLSYAAQQGAEALRRGADLARPEVRNIDVLRSWYDQSADKPEFVVLLQPTHPFRSPADLTMALGEMVGDSLADSMVALAPQELLLGYLENGYFKSQTAPEWGGPMKRALYRNTGAFYILRSRSTIVEGVLLGQKVRGFVLTDPEIEVDIDRETDLLYAEAVLQANYRKLSRFL